MRIVPRRKNYEITVPMTSYGNTHSMQDKENTVTFGLAGKTCFITPLQCYPFRSVHDKNENDAILMRTKENYYLNKLVN